MLGSHFDSKGTEKRYLGAFFAQGLRPVGGWKKSRKAQYYLFKPPQVNSSMSASFYILRLKSGGLYIGVTTDLDQRYKEYCSDKACRTTQIDPPIGLIYSEECATFADARKREAQIKRWSRAKTLFSCKTTTPSQKIQAIFTTFYCNINRSLWS